MVKVGGTFFFNIIELCIHINCTNDVCEMRAPFHFFLSTLKVRYPPQPPDVKLKYLIPYLSQSINLDMYRNVKLQQCTKIISVDIFIRAIRTITFQVDAGHGKRLRRPKQPRVLRFELKKRGGQVG